MGLFIAIEGGDGSGKGTQSALLKAFFESMGKTVSHIAFPRHGEFSSYYADQYLNGAYGGINDVHADLASLPYALDRFAARKEIRKALKQPNSVVIADRYVASNLAHQGAKFNDTGTRRAYYDRMLQTEFQLLDIPKPDLNILLLVPSDIAQTNIDKKPKRAYTERTRDIHEEDASHLDKARANYEELTTLYPNWFKAVDCVKKGKMRAIEDIQRDIQKLLTI